MIDFEAFILDKNDQVQVYQSYPLDHPSDPMEMKASPHKNRCSFHCGAILANYRKISGSNARECFGRKVGQEQAFGIPGCKTASLHCAASYCNSHTGCAAFSFVVHLVKGYFEDTVPDLRRSHKRPIAILRLDGDLYAPTKVVMVCMYPQLSVGGWLIIDDYGRGPKWLRSAATPGKMDAGHPSSQHRSIDTGKKTKLGRKPRDRRLAKHPVYPCREAIEDYRRDQNLRENVNTAGVPKWKKEQAIQESVECVTGGSWNRKSPMR